MTSEQLISNIRYRRPFYFNKKQNKLYISSKTPLKFIANIRNAQIEYQIKPANEEHDNSWLLVKNYKVIFIPASFIDGDYVIYHRAILNQARGEISQFKFTLDNTPPELKFYDENGNEIPEYELWAYSGKKVILKAIDTGSGISQIGYKIGHKYWVEINGDKIVIQL